MRFAVVGSGFSGSIVASHLAKLGHNVEVFESRDHVGGNCYTYRDEETGVLIHKYGPHIFHTDNEVVWKFINQYSQFDHYINRVKACSNGAIFSLPINLHTINQFFNKTFSPDEAKNFISSLSKKTDTIESFEDQALNFIGEDLYNAFFKGYTIKQWGIHPSKLPASILKRLPVRFNYDDNYFNHKFQGMPVEGYTPIFEKLLSHKYIRLSLNAKFFMEDTARYDHVFYTGPIDSYFDYKHGRLAYRTLDFKEEVHTGDYQGCAVLNYNDEFVPFTRITEHKHFAPKEVHEKSVIYKEYSREAQPNDIKYYPIRLVDDKALLEKYIDEAKQSKNVSFMGRLGTYRYMDMDVTIAEALKAVSIVEGCIETKTEIPVFFEEVL